MERNRSYVTTLDHCKDAALKVYQMTVLLRLNEQQFDDAFTTDVYSKMVGGMPGELSRLETYTNGLQEAYRAAIKESLCEFVFILRDGAKVLQADARKYDPVTLFESTCCYSWKDSDYNFTEPVDTVQETQP
jgi:hypothetical protein